MPAPSTFRLTRRTVVSGGALGSAALVLGLWPRGVSAQEAGTDNAAPQQFSFDLLSEEMRGLAAEPFAAAAAPEGFLGDLDYDSYRLIRFNPDRARWQDQPTQFRVHAFHMGWLFPEPVRLFEITATEAGDQSAEMLFTTDDFEYLNELAEQVPEHAELPGVAGFRLNFPLNRPDLWDELVSFLGASYFRALGRESAYGQSARGLALNTATTEPEEFPRFSRFYLQRHPENGGVITVYATLEGPSVTGAYRIIITPGGVTEMEVTARLFFRQDVVELGIAPLTSMFLFSEKNRADFDDYRPNVHDSDGLRIVRADGNVIWRPLNNPPRLATSYFGESAPRAFGLHQRDRDFESYQDIGARYERRPSVDVEPLGDWGPGAIKLVEIPSDLEANDNIVAYWVPSEPALAGQSREFSYRLRWGDLPPDPTSPLAYVFETRSGAGGVSGIESEANTRKFVVDFKGGPLALLPEDAELEPVTNVANGELIGVTLQKIPGHDIWRASLDLRAEPDAVVEIGLHIAGYDRKLTETWLYQWVNA